MDEILQCKLLASRRDTEIQINQDVVVTASLFTVCDVMYVMIFDEINLILEWDLTSL